MLSMKRWMSKWCRALAAAAGGWSKSGESTQWGGAQLTDRIPLWGCVLKTIPKPSAGWNPSVATSQTSMSLLLKSPRGSKARAFSSPYHQNDYCVSKGRVSIWHLTGGLIGDGIWVIPKTGARRGHGDSSGLNANGGSKSFMMGLPPASAALSTPDILFCTQLPANEIASLKCGLRAAIRGDRSDWGEKKKKRKKN